MHPTLETPSASALPVNDLAAAYQPRRVWAAAVSIAWNLLLAGSFLAGRGAWRLYAHLADRAHHLGLAHLAQSAVVAVLYLAIFFIAYALFNYPIDLWFGYLGERQFGLAKDGVRAWTRDWLTGVAHHGVLFVFGSTCILLLQAALPMTWLAWVSLLLLVLFLLTSYFALALLPHGLFHLEPIDDATQARLERIIYDGECKMQNAKCRKEEPDSHSAFCISHSALGPLKLPPLLIYSAPHLRDFSGGLIGLGARQVMLISRSTIAAASESLLRFVLLHDMGHRRYHHLLLSTLAGWAWVVLGLCASHAAILHFSPRAFGLPPYLAWLALTLSIWMALGEPLLAYLGRRLEYQADRFYLRHGGTIEQMQIALEELSRRNLARTEGLRRRQTIFHPLPSVWNRLHAAKLYARALEDRKETVH